MRSDECERPPSCEVCAFIRQQALALGLGAAGGGTRTTAIAAAAALSAAAVIVAAIAGITTTPAAAAVSTADEVAVKRFVAVGPGQGPKRERAPRFELGALVQAPLRFAPAPISAQRAAAPWWR